MITARAGAANDVGHVYNRSVRFDHGQPPQCCSAAKTDVRVLTLIGWPYRVGQRDNYNLQSRRRWNNMSRMSLSGYI